MSAADAETSGTISPVSGAITRRVALAALAAAPVGAGTGPVPPLVEAPAGRWRGAWEDGVQAFRGIRFGAPPQRFQAPEPAARIREVQVADRFAPSAPQRGAVAPQSEHCLFLNVWTPGGGAMRWPVLVYLHGGANSIGTVVEPRVIGARLAARGAVVVTVNHRLNALGYFRHPAFPDGANAGQLDLVLALHWVRANIAAFGGDPGSVTLFGQSGGGAKIATLMSMPAARGLFHRAWTMSGQQVTVSGPMNAARRGEAWLKAVGASVEQVMLLPVERLVAALAAPDPALPGPLYFGPVLDMGVVPRHPFYPDADPGALDVPLVLGNTISETRAFFPPDHPCRAGLDWTNMAERLGPELRVDIDPAWVVAQFRAQDPALTPDALFIRATTAARSWRGQLIEAEARAATRAPAFVYQLDWRDAGHMDDIPLVFGTTTDPAAFALRDRMMAALLRFAETGDPGWPAYRLPERRTMVFDAVSRVVDNPRTFERELFARVPYVQPGS